ncbi:MAG: DUF1028 domain-containing protein [Candidatus Kariarchaeaceae archaeon]
MTFSIVAFDPNTGDLGVAVQSKFISVGSIVPWANAKIGAVATQAYANTSFGPQGLIHLNNGLSAEEVLDKLLSEDKMRDHRQVAVIDALGEAAAHTGSECFYWAGHEVGTNFSCQGNILISEETVQSMASAFETTKGDLADKLLATLHAADQEGRGDVRGKQSASLLIVRDEGGYGGYTDRLVDLRVDEHHDPIKELQRVFDIYDMIFLSREDESNLLALEGEIATNIKATLVDLNYITQSELSSGSTWAQPEVKAFEAWVGINNFENKWRDDGKIWKSIYDYVIREKGTPAVNLKKMSDI